MGVIRLFIDTWSVRDIPFFTSAAKNRRNQVSWMLGAYPVVGIPPMPRCDLRRYGWWEARHQPLALWFICQVKRRLHLRPLECWVGRRMTSQRWGRSLTSMAWTLTGTTNAAVKNHGLAFTVNLNAVIYG